MPAEFDALVAAAAHGDAQAYGRLVDQTSPLVSSIALAIVRDLELSRDVAQEVFLAVWRDLRNLRNPASFLPWLRQIARNRAKIALRTQWRRRKLGETGLDEMLAAVTDARPGTAEQMIADEQRLALAAALSNLPGETREVLTLFYREGESVAQVAALLDLTEAAVRKRLSRARQALREGLLTSTGEMLRSSRPDGRFTAVVIAALPASAPSGAVLGGAAASKLAGSSLWALAAKALLPFSGALLGGAGGALGVVAGARKWHKDAADERERRQLRVHTSVGVVVVLAFGALLPIVWGLTHSRWCAVAWFLAFVASIAVLEHVWLPRIVRRRLEAEMRENPQLAMARRRKERRNAVLGWTFGIVFGTAGLALGLWFAR